MSFGHAKEQIMRFGKLLTAAAAAAVLANAGAARDATAEGWGR